jgi:hypothetical protein
VIAKLLGSRFLALVPANKNPCLRYHIFGSCASSNCQFVHKLTPAPAPDIVMGIQARIKGLHPCPSDSKPSNQNNAIATRKGAELGSILTNDALTSPQIPPPMTTMDMLMDTITPAGPIPELRVSDTIQPKDPLFVYLIAEAHGKSTIKSLMHPQDIAQRLLPRNLFLQLQEFCYKGCPVQCSPVWTPEVIKAAMAAGPHVSALILENTKLIWEDIEYQVNVGFVRIISASDLFGENQPQDLKISRVAVVPQDNQQGQIILNL